jgi:predicted nucleotide-binding protein (sugar kinase/HSP70/actin superfamily)
VTEGALPGVEIATGEAKTAAGAVVETATVEVSEVATAAPLTCTPQCVLTVALRPRFHSSQLKEDRFTAGSVYQNTGSSNPKSS